jgi:hypothetical protein
MFSEGDESGLVLSGQMTGDGSRGDDIAYGVNTP